MNVLGWMGLTVLGTLVTLWPTMLHTQVDDHAVRSARRALPVLAVSVAVLAGGAVLGSRPVAVAGVVGYLVGFVIVGVPRVREARRPKSTGFATWSVGAAMLWFTGSIAALGVILAVAEDWESAADAADRLAGPLLVGFAAQLLIGALAFLIPVVLGGGPTIARSTNAALDRAATLRIVMVNVGLVVAVCPVPDSVRRLSAAVVLVGLAVFLPLVVQAVVLSRRPSEAPELPGR